MWRFAEKLYIILQVTLLTCIVGNVDTDIYNRRTSKGEETNLYNGRVSRERDTIYLEIFIQENQE